MHSHTILGTAKSAKYQRIYGGLQCAEKKQDSHLGYRGVEKLIKGCNPRPKLVLIGEFWAGLADLRMDIAHGSDGCARLTQSRIP